MAFLLSDFGLCRTRALWNLLLAALTLPDLTAVHLVHGSEHKWWRRRSREKRRATSNISKNIKQKPKKIFFFIMNVCLNQVLCLIIPFLLLLRLDYSYLVLSVSLSLNVLLCFRSSFCITIDILHFIFFFIFRFFSFSCAASSRSPEMKFQVCLWCLCAFCSLECVLWSCDAGVCVWKPATKEKKKREK